MADVDISWSLEAPLETLRDATNAARINSNAINPGRIDADLIFPSFFCTSRPAWIKALAYLYVRNLQFRLFLVGTTPAGVERWRYRILPVMDEEMLSLMREIDTAESRELETLGHRIELIAERLRAIEWDQEEPFL